MAVSEKLFEAVSSHQSLKTLRIKCADMSLVPPELLVKAVRRLEGLEIRFSHLNVSQVIALFTSLAQLNHLDGSCQPRHGRQLQSRQLLRKIEIWGNDLSSLQPRTLVQAVSKMEEVDLSDNMLTRHQAEAVFVALGSPSSRVRKLSLGNNDLNSVDSQLMAKGVNKLEHCDLRNANLNVHQVTSILRQSLEQTSLQMLNIWWFTGPPLDAQLIRLASQVIPEFLFEKDIL